MVPFLIFFFGISVTSLTPRGVLCCFHTSVGSGHFLGFKILIFLGVFRNLIFLGYEDFVDIFWGHHKIGLYLGFISMHFRVFS